MELYGRTKITTKYKSIGEDNVLDFLKEVLPVHGQNVCQMDYLYACYKGKFDILGRTKDVRPEICNKYTENRAKYIADFHTGYICSENIQYCADDTDADKIAEVARLNQKMVHLGMGKVNNDIVRNGMIFGTAYKYVEADKDTREIHCVALDPRENFLVYDRSLISRPIAAVFCRKDEKSRPYWFIYTKNETFRCNKGNILDRGINPYGRLPLFEFPANESRLGSFETVLSQIDALNMLNSNRLDGVEQFIQSLLVFYNCQLEEGTTPQMVRDKGALFLKSVGEQKADLKEISSQLDQTQTQVLKNDILKAMNEIAAVPAQSDANTSDSSNNGAVILKNGFRHTEASAKNYELQFDAAENIFLDFMLDLYGTMGEIEHITAADVAPKFPRRNYEDYQSKATVLTMLLGNENIHPETAFEFCSMFPDATTEYLKGQEWRKQLKDEQSNGTVLAEV